LKFLTRRRILAALTVTGFVLVAAVGSLILFLNSSGFEAELRHYFVDQIHKRTGTAVSIGHLEWSLRRRRFHLDDLILRGLEGSGEPALAHFSSVDIGVSLRSLFQRKFDFFELTITRPEFHILVDKNGRTNFPAPPAATLKPFNLEISIDNFTVREGLAIVNEDRVDVDFSVTNLATALTYRGATGVLSSHLKYEGLISRPKTFAIPYNFDGDMDYTHGTLVTHRIQVNSGASVLKLQGRVNELLTRNLAARLEYTGTIRTPFLSYFYPKDHFAGVANIAGFLEFSNGYFFTRGTVDAPSIEFNGWRAEKIRSEYTYHFPDRRASLRNLQTQIVGATAAGSVVIEDIPGPSKVDLDIDYSGVDSAALVQAYPWDSRYRIFSRLSGTLQGWFEGRLERYLFSGNAQLASYTPDANPDIVALPLDGVANYEVEPGQIRVTGADMRWRSTHIKADGLIHEVSSNVRLFIESADLSDVHFLYEDANGSGTFDGSLIGPVRQPEFVGRFTLRNHVYDNKWKIDAAEGQVQLNIADASVSLRNGRIMNGRSELTVNGNAGLTGTPIDLRIQSSNLFGEDLTQFVGHKIRGSLSGTIHVTSLRPVQLEGDVRGDSLTADDRLVGTVHSHVRYFEPKISLDSVSVAQNGSMLTGNASLNRSSEEVNFAVRVASLDFNYIRWLGLPRAINGVIRQADLQGDGTLKRPNIRGDATIQNLAFQGQVFPQVAVNVTSSQSLMNVTAKAGSDLALTAKIDTTAPGYPFTADAVFSRYPVERIARLTQGRIAASGRATVSGNLTELERISGNGNVESAEAVIQERTLHTTEPFTFDFASDHLSLSTVRLAGEATQVAISGTIGFGEQAALGLDVNGNVDLAILAAANSNWTTTGMINLVDGRVRGTLQNPDLRGVAHFNNVSVGRRGLFTSLSELNGDVFFDENRMTLSALQGHVGGGTVRLQGNAVLRDQQIDAMNIQIESHDVRVRYPEGLRTVLEGNTVLRGSWDSPLLEGNLQIQKMTYRSSFEEFLTMFTSLGSGDQEVPTVGQLRLALHVQGGKNITIENELANVEARVDLDIKGTVNKPALTGHIEASGGTLTFQGKRYQITRGNVDFTDPLRIEPVIDVQAEAELRDYRVILAISGRGDRLRLDMRSDPPLSQLEIVNLIAGGRSREELAAAGTRTTSATSERLFQGGAASILSDLLQQRIGSRLGVLGNSVRIDPFLVGAENDPKARITLSQQFSKDLSVTYSQDVSSNRQQIIQIEYFVTKNTSILASRDETGALGLDVKVRRRFRQR
jgi:autotransporter translocation and assembly factor TamB